MQNYTALFDHSKKIKLLESISALLEWDQETFMPKGSAAARAEQVELLASLAHQEKTSVEFAKKLDKLIDIESGQIKNRELSHPQQVALKRWRRDYKQQAALPNSFVKEFANLSAKSMHVWAEARKTNDFKLFAPYLSKIIDLSRKKADYLGYDKHPYDALLDCFEPEMTVAELSPLFEKVAVQIKTLLKKILAQKPVETKFLHGKFSHDKQMAFGKFVLEKMGYDFDKGRLDLSTHPFSTAMHPTDSRITTRLHTSSIFDCISAVLHEGGHGLYEMGLLPKHYGSPLGESVSLGIHESQSRFWETRIGQSKAFWRYFLPHLKTHFKAKLGNISLDTFYKGINHVHPSLIRVESDEVTYSLHVILRFELEKALIEGTLNVNDIPSSWNFLMETLLNITPPTDREGCLQDVHWSMGGFGYFPTYALGNLYAGQFFETFAKAHPDWEKRVAKGDLLFAKQWLGENIHQHGRLYSAKELVKKVSGKPLSETPYLNYLKAKYADIYHI